MADPLLNDRELASLILLVAFVVLVVVLRGRAATVRAARTILSIGAHPKLFVPTLLYLVAILAALIPASSVGLWEPAL